MPVIKRLNINTFKTEADNDAFIKELTTLWEELDLHEIRSKVSVDINKDKKNQCRMTAFVTIENEQVANALEYWVKNVVVPARNKYPHENLLIDAELVSTIEK